MKRKKILLTAISSIAMLLTLGACNNSKENTDNQPSDDKGEDSKTEVVVETKTCKELYEIGLALKDNNNKVSTSTYKVEGTVTAIVGKSFTIQDSTGAFYVYFKDSSITLPAKGNKVSVTCKVTNYNGLIESEADTAQVTVLSQTGDTYQAANYDQVSAITQDKQSTLASFTDLVLTSIPTVTEGKGFTINTTYKSNSLDLRVNADLTDFNDIKSKITSAKVKSVLSVENTLIGWYSGKPQLTLLSADSITINYTEVESISIKDGDVTLNSKTLNVNDTFELSDKVNVLPDNASNKAVTYESSNASIAEVSNDGIVTAKNAGVCSITIKSVSKEDVTASLSITVEGKSIDQSMQGEWDLHIDDNNVIEFTVESLKVIIDQTEIEIEASNINSDNSISLTWTDSVSSVTNWKLTKDATKDELLLTEDDSTKNEDSLTKYSITRYQPITSLPDLENVNWITNISKLKTGSYVIGCDARLWKASSTTTGATDESITPIICNYKTGGLQFNADNTEITSYGKAITNSTTNLTAEPYSTSLQLIDYSFKLVISKEDDKTYATIINNGTHNFGDDTTPKTYTNNYVVDAGVKLTHKDTDTHTNGANNKVEFKSDLDGIDPKWVLASSSDTNGGITFTRTISAKCTTDGCSEEKNIDCALAVNPNFYQTKNSAFKDHFSGLCGAYVTNNNNYIYSLKLFKVDRK